MVTHTPSSPISPKSILAPFLTRVWLLAMDPRVPVPSCLTIAALSGSYMSTDVQLWPSCPLQSHLQLALRQPVHFLVRQVGQHLSEAWVLGKEQGAVGDTARGQSWWQQSRSLTYLG